MSGACHGSIAGAGAGAGAGVDSSSGGGETGRTGSAAGRLVFIVCLPLIFRLASTTRGRNMVPKGHQSVDMAIMYREFVDVHEVVE